MARKKITVRNLLELMDKGTPVHIQLFAYNVHYGDTTSDGMKTAGDCLENMNVPCLNAMVTFMTTKHMTDDCKLYIQAEICA